MKEHRWPKKVSIWIMILMTIIGCFAGYIIGYSSGYMSALNWAVEKALWMFDMKGVEIDINGDLITAGLYRYKRNMDDMLSDWRPPEDDDN